MSGMVRRRPLAATLLLLALPAGAEEGASARLEVGAAEAVLAEPFPVEVVVRLPAGFDVVAEPPGPLLGDLTLLDGSWEGDPPVRRFRGRLAAYRTGEVPIPSIAIALTGPEGPAEVRTEPATIEVKGALPPPAEGEPPPEIADLKPPATVAPDYGPLLRASGLLLALLAAAAAGWWAARRLAGRFAKVPVATDPFHRMSPDAWAYEALSALLARRLAEDGREDLFHEELARIVKRYLSGRFRVDLAEKTTAEIAPALAQAGVAGAEVAAATALLERSDLAKFARESAGPEGCKAAVEAAYRLVDATRPAPATPKEAA